MWIYCVFLLFPITFGSWLPKIVWTYWDEPLQPGSYEQLFHLNHIKYTEGWDLRLLNKYTIKQVLKQIPDFAGLPKHLNNLIPAHRADFLRITLLYHFGGVWIDFGEVLTESISWIQTQNLVQDKNVRNRYGSEPNLLFFSYEFYAIKQQYRSPKTSQVFQLMPGYEIWFIACKPKTQFMKLFVQIAYDVQLHRGYVHQEYWNAKIKQKNIKLRNTVIYLLFNQIIQYITQTKQQQLDSKSQNKIERALASQYYGIWHIPSEAGPFGFFKPYRNFISSQQFLITQVPENQLHQDGIPTRYFIKLTKSLRDPLKFYFSPPKTLLSAYLLSSEFPKAIEYYYCPPKINKGSIFQKYLLQKNSTVKSYKQILQFKTCSRQKQFYISTITLESVILILLALALFILIRKLSTKKSENYQNANLQSQKISAHEDQQNVK